MSLFISNHVITVQMWLEYVSGGKSSFDFCSFPSPQLQYHFRFSPQFSFPVHLHGSRWGKH